MNKSCFYSILLTLSTFSQYRGGDESHDESDRQRLEESHCDVEEDVVVKHLEPFHFLGLSRNLLRGSARGTHVLQHESPILFGKIRHEVEVDKLPGEDVESAGDEHYQ